MSTSSFSKLWRLWNSYSDLLLAEKARREAEAHHTEQVCRALETLVLAAGYTKDTDGPGEVWVAPGPLAVRLSLYEAAKQVRELLAVIDYIPEPPEEVL